MKLNPTIKNHNDLVLHSTSS